MIDFSSLLQPDRDEPAHSLHALRKGDLEAWLGEQPQRVRVAVEAARFQAKPGEFVLLPDDDAAHWSAAVGLPEQPGPWDLAPAVARLREGRYRLANADAGASALGWLLAHYRFDRYRAKPDPLPLRVLLTREAARIDEWVEMAGAVALVRDLVNTPAADLGPAELEAAVRDVAKGFGAQVTTTEGDALDDGYPMIAAVGRAATTDRSPRLVELEWGEPAHPRVAIVGKGVCFDSGGLNLKPGSSMNLMKKDMGGAAHALALARLVMAARLPVRLHLLIPAVEDAGAGAAFRPRGIPARRKGLAGGIGNTHAEGRLILGDALARAAEEKPELLIDFATLTGAARVALGPALPALFANDETLAADLAAATAEAADPLWRLPLWGDYADMLKSDVADINNAGEGGMAGAITAALFLQKFVPADLPWAHMDTFAWMPTAKPGRPKGGEALGLRAAWQMLRTRYRPL